MDMLTITGHFSGNGELPVTIDTRGTPLTSVSRGTSGTDSTFTFTVNQEVKITLPHREEPSASEKKFRTLADSWRKETRYLSSINKKAMHPAYQQIIGMGQEAIPLILQDLKRTRGHWLWALFAITGEDPASEGSTFTEAVDAWLNWGISH